MKKFVIKILFLAIAFFVFDKLFYIVAYYSAKTEVDKRLELLVNGEINKDIVIVGSSRGSRDIIAKQIEDKTGFSAYNVCYPGSNVLFHNFIVKTLYKFNEPPKYLILVVDDDEELTYCNKINFRKDRLYPLVKYPYIWKTLAKRDGKDMLLSQLLILYRLNKYNFNLRKKRFTPRDTIMECGSMPVSWRRKRYDWSYDTKERVYDKSKEEPDKVEAYKEMIQLVKSNNSKLIIVFPPQYKPFSFLFEERIKQLSGEGACFYKYNSENPVYKNKEYYFDDSHLVRKGAVIFTNEIVELLKDKATECN